MPLQRRELTLSNFRWGDSPFHQKSIPLGPLEGPTPLAYPGANAPTFPKGEDPLLYTWGHRPLRLERGIVWLPLDKSMEVHGRIAMPPLPQTPTSTFASWGSRSMRSNGSWEWDWWHGPKPPHWDPYEGVELEFKEDLFNPWATEERWEEYHEEHDGRQPCGMPYMEQGQPIEPIDTPYTNGCWAARGGHGKLDTEHDYLHAFRG